jgi:hypothetical protein
MAGTLSLWLSFVHIPASLVFISLLCLCSYHTRQVHISSPYEKIASHGHENARKFSGLNNIPGEGSVLHSLLKKVSIVPFPPEGCWQWLSLWPWLYIVRACLFPAFYSIMPSNAWAVTSWKSHSTNNLRCLEVIKKNVHWPSGK